MNDGRGTSVPIRWTQRFVLGAIGEDLEPFEDALRRADTALYDAKAQGRNGWAVRDAGSVATDDVRRPA